LVEPEVPICVVLAAEAEDRLWAQNCGPGFDEIDQFVELMSLCHLFSARDLVLLYQALLDRSIRSDIACPIEVQHFSEFQATPTLPPELSPIDLTSETERVLSTLAAINRVDDGWHFGSGLNGPANELEVTTTVHQATGPRHDVLAPFPATLVGAVRTLTSARELIAHRVSERVWQHADSPEQLHLAIMLGALDILQRTGAAPDPKALKSFSIGPAFMESLSACQCGHSGRYSGAALDLCAQLVSNTCNRPIGPFGRPAQERRAYDGAAAWRVHLTKGHEGLRLMYWDSGDHIEFANIGVKHELVIVAGRPGLATAPDYASVFSTSED
jgi:hypothetical protein